METHWSESSEALFGGSENMERVSLIHENAGSSPMKICTHASVVGIYDDWEDHCLSSSSSHCTCGSRGPHLCGSHILVITLTVVLLKKSPPPPLNTITRWNSAADLLRGCMTG